MKFNSILPATILCLGCGVASRGASVAAIPDQDGALSEIRNDGWGQRDDSPESNFSNGNPSEESGRNDWISHPDPCAWGLCQADSATVQDPLTASDPGVEEIIEQDDSSESDLGAGKEVSPSEVPEVSEPIPAALTLELPNGNVYPWGSEIPYKVYLTYNDGSKNPVYFPKVAVETTYKHVLSVDEKGRVWGVGFGTGMILVRFTAETEVFSAFSKVQVHDFAGEPPLGDRCEEAMDATGGLWMPVNLAVAWDDWDPPQGCGSLLVPHSGPEVHFRLAPALSTTFYVFVHPAAALDPMISVVDDCGDAAHCLASVNETGEGENELVEITVPGGETRIVVIEGARGEAGWFSVTIEAKSVEPGR